MATTTNFGWETPDDTDLVKDGALAMRTLGNGIDTSMVDLKGGTTGQVLSKTTNTDMDFTWITPAGQSFAGCLVNRSADLSTSNGTITTITFDEELYDTDGYHSTTTNTNRLTIPSGKAGYYLWTVQGAWETNTTGQRQFIFYKNGTRLATGFDSITDSDGYATLTRTSIINLAVGDYIEVRGYQSSGGTLAIRFAELQMSIVYLGA